MCPCTLYTQTVLRGERKTTRPDTSSPLGDRYDPDAAHPRDVVIVLRREAGSSAHALSGGSEPQVTHWKRMATAQDL